MPTPTRRARDIIDFSLTRSARFRFSEAPDDHHHDPEPVPDVNNALDRSGYPQSGRHEKIADLFYNPGKHYK